jgi:hypothetical protein
MNLVYAKGHRPVDNKLARGLDTVLKNSYEKSVQAFMKNAKFFETSMPSIEPGKTVTFRKADDVIFRSLHDGVSPHLAMDHARDMGYTGRRVDVAIWNDPFKWQLIDGPMAGRTITIEDRPPGHMMRFPDSSRYQIHTYKRDSLSRYFYWESEDIGVFRAEWKTQDPNKQQGGAIMAQTKVTTDEKPIEQQPVKLGVYFRVNGLPQELTQKQANEHVAKLLTLGAAEVNIQRFIRDDTSSKYASARDYK